MELEHLEGTGLVTARDGEEIQVKYDIHITQDETDAGPGRAPAFKHVCGRVWSVRDLSFAVTHYRENMTLQMEDGRQFKFFHKDSNGTIGLNKWIG
jgi:hypothetical protein